MGDPKLDETARSLTDGKQTPKHQQLREILDDLVDNHLKPGDMLPGERALEEQYGVSRITVRRAIGDLVASGKLRRARGKGTFVVHSPMVARLHLASFSDEMAAQNVESTSKILSSAWSQAPHDVTHFFRTDEHEYHTHLIRLRLGNNQPLCIDDGWYNSTFAPNLLENAVYQSVYSILENTYNVTIDNAEQIITAVAANPHEAQLLDVEVGCPLLKVIRLATSHDRPIEWCSSLYRTDRYALRTLITKA